MPTLDKNAICNSEIRNALKLSTKLDALISKGKSQYLGSLKNQLNEMSGGALSPLDDVSSSIDDMNNNANQSANDLAESGMDSIEVEDVVSNIAYCLGISAPDIDISLPNNNPAKAILDIANSIFDSVMELLDEALQPFEKAAGELISNLENLVPTDIIDALLDAIECLAGCPGADRLPTQLDIENKLNSVGLNINSEIDFTTTGLSDMDSIPPEVRTQSLNIKNKINATKNATKNLFDKSPF